LSTAVENNWCRDLSPACFFTATWRISRLSRLAVLLMCWCYLSHNKKQEDLLPRCAVLQLLPSPQIIREAGFSSYAARKSKYRYWLDISTDMRI
jgi:hypothetical protein